MLRGLRCAQRRGVMTVPDHILALPQRAREYKIGRVRLSASLDEVQQVLCGWKAQGVLGRDEVSIGLHMCAMQKNRDCGLWMWRLMHREFPGELSVYDYNNFLTFEFACWRPHDVLAAYVDMARAGVHANNDTYATLLQVCAEFMKRSAARGGREREKFRRVAEHILAEVVPRQVLRDGRYHLLRAVHNWYVEMRDHENVAKYRAILADNRGDAEPSDVQVTSYNALDLDSVPGRADMAC
eukprot:TRINITY_DN6905_c0_g1_i1.p1 TRINITY_DN6905_c0_g1~~TRINITY_DN6905_c0_g1_i1.p1  ORF type:complete len:240 (+),score=62.83 TRINITY_DN6905_c0_g1_i1:36-755(+)